MKKVIYLLMITIIFLFNINVNVSFAVGDVRTLKDGTNLFSPSSANTVANRQNVIRQMKEGTYKPSTANTDNPVSQDDSAPPADSGVTTGGAGTATANDRARSMLGFFKTETEVDVENLSQEELKVYGAFISNFFVPFQTKISDLTASGGVSTTISQKFFGSDAQTAQVTAVNKKLQDALVLLYSPENKASATLYDSNKKPLTGAGLINKVGSSDTKVYKSSGGAYFDLGTPAYRASLKTLYSVAPNMLVSKSGIGKVSEMYLDGFGNIWGNYNGTKSPEDYVLIMPAAINPMFFGGKFPVSNVFVTGMIAKNPSDIGNKPYYNAYTNEIGENLVGIFGIHSPSRYIGNTDAIIGGGGSDLSTAKVKEFVTSGVTNNNTAEVKIMISTNPSKVDTSLSGINDLVGDKTARLNVFNYFASTVMLTLDNLADEMYFFATDKGVNAADSSLGSWSDPKSMVKGYNMFNYAQDQSKFRFYDGAYSSTNYSKIVNGVASDDKNTKLVGAIGANSKFENLIAEWVTKGTVDSKDKALLLDEALEGASIRTSNHIFNIVPESDSVKRLPTSDGIIFKGRKPAGIALTDNDSALLRASIVSSAKLSGLADGGFKPAKIPFVLTNLASSVSVDSVGSSKVLYAFYNTLFTYNTFSANSTYINALSGKSAGTSVNGVFGAYKTGSRIADDTNNFAGIYWSYLVGVLGVSMNEDGSINPSGGGSASIDLPEMTIAVKGGSFDGSGLFSSDTEGTGAETKEKNKSGDITDYIYDLLTPEYSTYKSNWFKSHQDSFIIGTHRYITNSWVNTGYTVSNDGATGYSSNVTYINSPSIADLPIIPTILDNYMSIYILILGVILLLMVFFALIRLRTVKEALMSFVFLGILVLIPLYYVGGISNAVNIIADKIYSDRFTYWAIIQQQQNQTSLLSAGSIKTQDDLVEANMNDSATMNSSSDNNTQAGVRIKWMSPKKDDVYEKLFNSSAETKAMEENANMFKWMFASYFYQQEFVTDDPLATYLYRPFSAIANEAKSNYESMVSNAGSAIRDNMASPIGQNYKRVVGLPDYRFNKILGKSTIQDVRTAEEVSASRPYTTSGDETPYHFWGLTASSITQAFLTSEYVLENTGLEFTDNDSDLALLKLTESPYYYFYNALKYRYTTGANDSSFKSALLKEVVFKSPQVSGNPRMTGATRDFLDMEGLFTYIIPYLQTSNDYVVGWTSRYGSEISKYDFEAGLEGATKGNSGTEGTETPTEEKETTSLNPFEPMIVHAEDGLDTASISERFQYEQTKKESLGGIWKLYSPWVDQLQAQGFSSKVSKGIFGESGYVSDLLNPASYEEIGRPMIFSEAGMYAHKLNYSDLSEVEEKIINVLDATYVDLMYLNNYRDYDDETLIAVAAMMATFNFNREFSDVSIFRESNMLYPQGFELKNFNYDAFMRMVLSNSTGEPIVAEKDLYERVVTKTSLATGIFLLVKDVFGVVVIPVLRMLVLVGLFVLTFLFSFTMILTKPTQIIQKAIGVLGTPAFYYMIYSIVFIYLTAYFVGDGETRYVGSKINTFTLTDPTLALGLLCLIDLVYAILLGLLVWKLVIAVGDNYKDAITSLRDLGRGTVGRVTAMLDGKVKPIFNVQPSYGTGVGGGTGTGDIGKEGEESNQRGYKMGSSVRRGRGIATSNSVDSNFDSKWLDRLMNEKSYMLGGKPRKLSREQKLQHKYYRNLDKDRKKARRVQSLKALGSLPLRAVKLATAPVKLYKKATKFGRRIGNNVAVRGLKTAGKTVGQKLGNIATRKNVTRLAQAPTKAFRAVYNNGKRLKKDVIELGLKETSKRTLSSIMAKARLSATNHTTAYREKQYDTNTRVGRRKYKNHRRIVDKMDSVNNAISNGVNTTRTLRDKFKTTRNIVVDEMANPLKRYQKPTKFYKKNHKSN